MIFTKREKIFAAIGVVLLVLAIFFWRRTIYENEQMKSISSQNAALTGQVTSYKDENGKLHGKVEVLTGDKDAYTALYQHSLDSIAKVIGVKPKNITGVIQTGIKDSGHINTKKVDTVQVYVKGKDGKVDTVEAYDISYNDTWISFKANLNSGNFTADYTIRDSLTYTEYFKRKGFLGLGKKVNYLDVTATNPNISFTSMKSIVLTNEKPNRLSIGPYIGYDVFSRRISGGISIQYALFRF